MTDASILAELLSASGDALYDWDLGADRMSGSARWNRVFGTTGRPPPNSAALYNIVHGDDRHLIFGIEAKSIDREYRLRRLDGELVWVHEYGLVETKEGRPVRQYGLLRTVEKKNEKAAIRDMQGRDDLTGCLSRGNLLMQIQKALEAAKTTGRPCAYLVLGIDKMSFVNEAVGPEAGDGLLRGVAQRLAEILPARALLGRAGGDMFGILLPDPLGHDFRTLAERLLQNFRNHPIVTSVVPLHITVSIGGVQLPAVAHNGTEAMIFAEQALHDAHQRSRNLFVEYTDSPERMQENRQMLDLGERVKHAFKHDGLRLAFQPVIDSQSGGIPFYEALVRMFGVDGQMIPAAEFVPVIEQMGLAFELDRHVLDLAVRELENAPDLCLAVNVSGLTAAQADWPEHVRRILGNRRPVAERLIIEITETAAIVDVSETRRFVDTLRELGGRVALDDFGAGFTSIRHLRSLALSIMKIDRDLLHDLSKNAEQQHLVRMLIEIGRGLGLKSVAEGVETAEVAEWLKNAKVDMMQGYYFGKPSLEKPWLSQKGAGTAAPLPQTAPREAAAGPTVIRVASSV